MPRGTPADRKGGSGKTWWCPYSVLLINPGDAGKTSPVAQAQILRDYGIPTQSFCGGTLEGLAEEMKAGRGVILEVNAGIVWNDSNAFDRGGANHAVTVTGVALDPVTQEVQGVYLNDSGNGKAAEFVDTPAMKAAWVNTGGLSVVTDVSLP